MKWNNDVAPRDSIFQDFTSQLRKSPRHHPYKSHPACKLLVRQTCSQHRRNFEVIHCTIGHISVFVCSLDSQSIGTRFDPQQLLHMLRVHLAYYSFGNLYQLGLGLMCPCLRFDLETTMWSSKMDATSVIILLFCQSKRLRYIDMYHLERKQKHIVNTNHMRGDNKKKNSTKLE